MTHREQRVFTIFRISNFSKLGNSPQRRRVVESERRVFHHREHKVFAIFRISISKQSERRNDVNRAPRASLQHRLQSPVCSLCLRGPCCVNFRICEIQFQMTCRCSRTCSPSSFTSTIGSHQQRSESKWVRPTGISTGSSARQIKLSISVSPTPSQT